MRNEAINYEGVGRATMQSLFIPLVHFSYFLILKDLVHSTIKESGAYTR